MQQVEYPSDHSKDLDAAYLREWALSQPTQTTPLPGTVLPEPVMVLAQVPPNLQEYEAARARLQADVQAGRQVAATPAGTPAFPVDEAPPSAVAAASETAAARVAQARHLVAMAAERAWRRDGPSAAARRPRKA